MKICFNARPVYDDISAGLFHALRRRSGEIHGLFVCVDSFEADKVRRLVPGADVRQLNMSVRENWAAGSEERLAQYEARYGCAPIWQYIYTDRFLVRAGRDYIVKTVCGVFAFFESIFSAGDIDYYYDETIATLMSYAAYLVSKKYGARYISQMAARGFDGTHHFIISEPFQLNCNFSPVYRAKSYWGELYVQADRFLSEFEEKELRPEYMKVSGRAPRLSINLLKLPLIYMKQRFERKFNDPFAYIYYRQYTAVLRPLLFYFRYLKNRRYFKKPEAGQRFVLFPLHYQPEASTCVCAQKYENQLFFIDSLAKSLPSGTLLYVKEHYAVLGHRETQFYKALGRYPNVVLIDPWENTRGLIRASEAVATLTGTAGWEAMLLRKPVLVGGNAFYQNAPGVFKAEDIYGRYRDILAAYVRPRRIDILLYLCEYLSTLRKGTLVTTAEAFRNKDNFDNAADSFLLQDRIWRQDGRSGIG